MPVKPLAEVVGVDVLARLVLASVLVFMPALGTEPGDLASGSVTVSVCTARDATTTEMASASFTSGTRQVALRCSPWGWKMQIHGYRVWRWAEGSFVGSTWRRPSRSAFPAHDAQNRSSKSSNGR